MTPSESVANVATEGLLHGSAMPQPPKRLLPSRRLVCRFLVGSDSSDDEDDKRVVRSAKDRRGEELKATCDEIRVRSAAQSSQEVCWRI